MLKFDKIVQVSFLGGQLVYLVTLFLFLALLFSIWKDNRSVLNPILLISFLIMSYFSVGSFFYERGFGVAHDILFGLGFIILPLIVFFSGIFLIYNGIILLKKEGKSKANLLSLLAGFGVVGFFLLIYIRIQYYQFFINSKLLNVLIVSISWSFLIFGVAFLGFMLYSMLYLFMPKGKQYDFIIIHGAGLLGGERVSPLLEKRILKAIEAYNVLDDKNVKLIVSGGQGPDEKISEAKAMADYIKNNTPLSNEAVLLEDKSTTTYENLLFAKALGETLKPHPRFLFVTNDYHVFRTSMFAKKIKMAGDGLGCKTASYYIPSAFIREFIAGVVYLKWLFIALYVPLILLLLYSYFG